MLLRRPPDAYFCAAHCVCTLQVLPFSSRDWSIMHLVLVPRRVSQPFGAAPRPASPELLVYASVGKAKPLFRLQLDGCKLERIDGATVSLRLVHMVLCVHWQP